MSQGRRACVSLYGRIVRTTVLPPYFRLRGYGELRCLRAMEETQWLSASETRERQWRELQRLLSYAYENIPFHRVRLGEAGLLPDELGDPDGLLKLPLLTRRELQEHEQALRTPDWPEPDLAHDSTGGSTGEPVRVCFSRASYDRRVASASRSDRWAGWDYGERTAHLWGLDPNPGARSRLRRVLSQTYWAVRREKVFNAFAPSDRTLEATTRDLMQFRPQMIIAYPTRAYEVARFMDANSLTGRIRPRGVITSGEALEEYHRQQIQRAFGCSVFNRYGCREFSLIASECEQHSGLHINSDNVYVEFLRDDGRPAAAGETARLVITDLTNYAMPLIRYVIGDAGQSMGEQCPCGRGMPLMQVVGRSCDTVVAPDGRLLSGIFFGHLLKHIHGVRRFQVRQPDPTHVEVLLVPQASPAAINEQELRWALSQIVHALRSGVQVTHRFVDDIPLTRSGKHQLVVSDVPVTYA